MTRACRRRRAAGRRCCRSAPRRSRSTCRSGGPVRGHRARTASSGAQNEQEVIATGDARAVRGDVTVLADRLIAYYRKKGTGPARHRRRARRRAAAGRRRQRRRDRRQRDLPAGGRGPRPHLHADRPGAGRPRGLRHRPGGAGDDRARSEADHAAGRADRARQHGILVAEAHGGGRGNAVVVTNDGRRLSADMLVAYTTPPDAAAAAGAPTPVAAQPAPAPGKQPADPLLAASGKLEKVEAFGNVEVRTADRHRARRSRRLRAGHRHRPPRRPCAHHPRPEPAERTGGRREHEDRHRPPARRRRAAGCRA